MALTLWLLVSACGREGTRRADEASGTRPPGEVASLPRVAPPPPPPRPRPRTRARPAGEARRIVAIGDLHGDLDATRRALRLAGAIDAQDRWVGGALVVVQVGDQIDRGDDDKAVLDLFERLRGEARRGGGAVHPLVGNHELMNVVGRVHSVTKRGLRAFDRFAPPAARKGLLSWFPAARRGRLAAFRPGGPYARLLAGRSVVIRVGRTVFVHGGLLPEHVRYGLERANRETRAFLRGERPKLPEVVWRRDGLVWLRRQSRGTPPPAACAELTRALALAGADRLVVGHTRQRRGINAVCDGRVWRVDVSLSSFYGKRPAQVLELQGARPRRLTERPDP